MLVRVPIARVRHRLSEWTRVRVRGHRAAMLRLVLASFVMFSVACTTSTVGEPLPDGAAPTGVCRGVAKSCWDFESGTECLEQVGCVAELGCVSEAPGCSALGRTTCAVQPSCLWVESASRCTVDATRCTPIDERSTCEASDGCRWDLGCRGEAVACDELTPRQCEAQDGCTLERR